MAEPGAGWVYCLSIPREQQQKARLKEAAPALRARTGEQAAVGLAEEATTRKRGRRRGGRESKVKEGVSKTKVRGAVSGGGGGEL